MMAMRKERHPEEHPKGASRRTQGANPRRGETTVSSAPLALAQLAAALAAIGGFEARPLVAVAVSGGPDGLAAMSAVRELPGCRLVRPLLAVPRARLAALLAAEGQPFLRDPSNVNPAFERARLRLQGHVIPGRPVGPNPESMNTGLWNMD